MCMTTLRRRASTPGGQAALLVTSLACCGVNAAAAAEDGLPELDKLFDTHAQVGAPDATLGVDRTTAGRSCFYSWLPHP